MCLYYGHHISPNIWAYYYNNPFLNLISNPRTPMSAALGIQLRAGEGHGQSSLPGSQVMEYVFSHRGSMMTYGTILGSQVFFSKLGQFNWQWNWGPCHSLTRVAVVTRASWPMLLALHVSYQPNRSSWKNLVFGQKWYNPCDARLPHFFRKYPWRLRSTAGFLRRRDAAAASSGATSQDRLWKLVACMNNPSRIPM